MTDQSLAPASLLYRFSIPVLQFDGKWSAKGFSLEDQHVIPFLSEIDGRKSFADVRIGWNHSGLYFDVDVKGKQQNLWCRRTQMTESDRFMVWVDTRDTHNIHRASRFCHWFLAMPVSGDHNSGPVASMLKINRAKEDSPALNQYKLSIASKINRDGYRLQLFIPDKCMSGWNPEEHKKIGFNYAIVDRELGWQTLASGPELPIEEDPSLWQTIELVSN